MNGVEKIIKKIKDEHIEYVGLINFASRGIMCNTEGLFKAFKYGVEVGVECTKTDVMRIIKENIKR